MSKYLSVFLISMIPILELRGSVPVAVGMGLPYIPALILCVLGNMVPVPFIYFFARKFLNWGAGKKYIGRICSFFLLKGERAGQKLVAKTGRGGLVFALYLFVAIPIPGTGAWTGTLGASFLDIGFKSTVAAVCAGVFTAGLVMALASTGVFSIIGL